MQKKSRKFGGIKRISGIKRIQGIQSDYFKWWKNSRFLTGSQKLFTVIEIKKLQFLKLKILSISEIKSELSIKALKVELS